MERNISPLCEFSQSSSRNYTGMVYEYVVHTVRQKMLISYKLCPRLLSRACQRPPPHIFGMVLVRSAADHFPSPARTIRKTICLVSLSSTQPASALLNLHAFRPFRRPVVGDGVGADSGNTGVVQYSPGATLYSLEKPQHLLAHVRHEAEVQHEVK